MRAEKNARVEGALRGVRLGKTWLRVECPFCAEDGHRDSKRSLGVSATTGYYSCFRCGTSGRLPEPPSPELAAQAQDSLEEEEIKTMEPPEGFCRLWEEDNWRSVSLEPAKAYLKRRHVSRAMMRELQIGCCDEGRYSGRVIVPMLSPDDEWYGFVSRLWVDKPSKNARGLGAMKYLYPPGMQRGRFLWNHAATEVETDDPLLVVEGVFDALPYFPDACATLGKLSEPQERALVYTKRPVVFVPDGDEWQSGWALAAKLRFGGQRAGIVRLPPRVDPDELPVDELRRIAAKSLDDPL